MKDEGKHAFFFIPHPSSFTMSLRPPNVTFYQRARQALNDPQLHIALDRATDTLTTLRSRTMGTFVDGDALRDQARMIRAHTLSRLDHYLAQFADAVEAADGRQGQVDGHRGDRPQPRLAVGGYRRDRNRPGRAHHSARG